MYNTQFTILFDSDETLFYTKIGLLEPNKKVICPLHYTVWGETKKECSERAEQLATALNDLKRIKELSE